MDIYALISQNFASGNLTVTRGSTVVCAKRCEIGMG